MYAEPVKGGHAAHKFLWKLIGAYKRHQVIIAS
jgi:hypothetical protein